MKGHSQSRAIVSCVAATLLLLLALLACKRKTEQSPAEKAAEAEHQANEIERATKRLQKVAALGDKVKALGAPTKSVDSSILQGTRNGYANFDVLLADELSEPNEFPKPRIRLDHYFATCAKHVKEKTVSSTDCSTRYVVVLKPGTYRTAEVAGNSYTPGRIDVNAYVFDMMTGEVIGGGRVTAKTPESMTTRSSNAEFEINEKLGEAAFESLAQALNVKTN